MGIFAQLNRQSTALGGTAAMPTPLQTLDGGETRTALPIRTPSQPGQPLGLATTPEPTGTPYQLAPEGAAPGSLYTPPEYQAPDLTTPYTKDLATLQAQGMEAVTGTGVEGLQPWEQEELRGMERMGLERMTRKGQMVGSTARAQQEYWGGLARGQRADQMRQAKVDRIMPVLTHTGSMEQQAQNRAVRINETANNFAMQLGQQGISREQIQTYSDAFKAELEEKSREFDEQLAFQGEQLEAQIQQWGEQNNLTQQQIDNQLQIALANMANNAAIAEDQMEQQAWSDIIGGATTIGGAYLLSGGLGAGAPAAAAIATPAVSTALAPSIATSYGGGAGLATGAGPGSYAAGGAGTATTTFLGGETAVASSYGGAPSLVAPTVAPELASTGLAGVSTAGMAVAGGAALVIGYLAWKSMTSEEGPRFDEVDFGRQVAHLTSDKPTGNWAGAFAGDSDPENIMGDNTRILGEAIQTYWNNKMGEDFTIAEIKAVYASYSQKSAIMGTTSPIGIEQMLRDSRGLPPQQTGGPMGMGQTFGLGTPSSALPQKTRRGPVGMGQTFR